MSETSEMPTGVEVEEKNPVVEAARAGVRTALEANESYREWRENLRVREGLFRVYETWDDARKRLVGSMTEADRNSLQTKLLEFSMKMKGITGSALDISLNMASKVMIVAGSGLVGVVALTPVTAVAGLPLAAGLIGGGWAAGRTGEGVARWAQTRAVTSVSKEFVKYKVREAAMTSARAPEILKAVVDAKVKNIITGFAYPEGKPVKPPMAKV